MTTDYSKKLVLGTKVIIHSNFVIIGLTAIAERQNYPWNNVASLIRPHFENGEVQGVKTVNDTMTVYVDTALTPVEVEEEMRRVFRRLFIYGILPKGSLEVIQEGPAIVEDTISETVKDVTFDYAPVILIGVLVAVFGNALTNYFER